MFLDTLISARKLQEQNNAITFDAILRKSAFAFFKRCLNSNNNSLLLNLMFFLCHIIINTFKTYCTAIVAKRAFFVCVAMDMGFS